MRRADGARKTHSGPRRGLPRGFSLLELVLAICIIGVVATVAVERQTKARVGGEREVFEATVASMRSALGIQVAQLIAKNRPDDIARLIGSNPMEYLAELPDNYRGAYYGIDPSLVKGGDWYFDRRDGTLVYRVRFEEYLDTRLGGPARIRLAVVPVYLDANGNGRFDAATDSLKGLSLRARDEYRWVDHGFF